MAETSRVAKVPIKSWQQMCEYAATQISNGGYTDWPLYPDEDPEDEDIEPIDPDIGDLYAECMRQGVLRIRSQEGGYPDYGPVDPLLLHYLRLPGHVEGRERHRTYVCALAPHAQGSAIVGKLLQQQYTDDYFYLWYNPLEDVQTNIPSDTLSLTEFDYQEDGTEKSVEMTTLNTWTATAERTQEIETLKAWIATPDRRHVKKDMIRLNIGLLYLIDKNFCRQRRSAGRLLLDLINSKAYVRHPRNHRSIIIGGETWQKQSLNFGTRVYSYAPS